MGGKRFTSGMVAAVVLALFFTAQAGAVVSHQFSEGEANQAKRFWTPERITRALERDPEFGVRPVSTTQPRHRPVTVNRPEVGKILGWDSRGGYSCTGTVIDTSSLRLVLTAAHCVLADGIWASKLLFLPEYKNGFRPYGTYRVKAAWVSNWWQRYSYGSYGTNFDIAILVTRKTESGARIGENVGAIPYKAYPERGGVTDIYGYPGAAMKGRVMRTCRTKAKPDWYGGRFFPGPTGILARCNMAAGSSGGPWVSRYENPDGTGTIGVVDGLTSTGFPQAGKNYLTSPYFGRILVRLIKATEGG